MKLWVGVFLVCLSLACFACNASASNQQEPNKVDCIDQQGIWINARFGEPLAGHCVTLTADAGQQCRSSGDCQSACVTDDRVKLGQAATGQCFSWSELTSHCVNTVDENGFAEGTICHD